METTAILSIFYQHDTYIFSLNWPHQSPLYPQKIIHASSSVGGITKLDKELRIQLNKTISEAVTQLRIRPLSGARVRNSDSHATSLLKRLGLFLFNYLLPSTVEEELRNLPEKMPIILTTNETEIPWELLHDGTQYLALKHPIGRRLWSTTPVRREPISEPSHRSFLFIANPTEDLLEADIEVEKLMDLFEPEFMAGTEVQFLACTRATRWEVLQALTQQYDLIHYSGHAEAGSLLLADDNLATEEIQKTLQGHPFVFLNACYSAKEMTHQEVDKSEIVPYAGLTARNLAEAFIIGGAAGFIGTLWPVFDQSSREFAEWFYTRLRKGMPVGEALRQTRQQMYEERPDDPIWASFVFYGDPILKVISAPAESETRHITVLVARVEGLLPLFDALNLEEAAQIRDQAINKLRQVAESTHGHFYAPMSDLLMVHFGVPIAYGNDTEQAIEAALRMNRTLHLFHQQEQKGLPARLGLKVGISTGSVLVRAVSTSNGADYEIVGQVEGIATTLAVHAEVNQIVLDEHTQQVARDKFAFEALPPLAMSAGSCPITRYRVLDKIGRSHPPVTAIVGREDELNELRKQWRKVKRGRGQVVGIEGPAGLGKTRLVEAFREQLAEYHPQCISTICHTYEQKQSYTLLAQVIRQLAGIESHDKESNQRHKIGQLVLDILPESTQASQEVFEDRVVLLSRVVGLPFVTSALDNLEPAQRQKILERVVVDILKTQATSEPIVLVLEDLQWADEASLAILDQVIRQVRRMPLLLLAVYRSNWGWPHENGRHKWIQTLQLEELEEDERSSLLEYLLGSVPSEELEQLIFTQTGGNPFFVKEYVRLLQENGGLIRDGDALVQGANLSQIPHFGKIEQVIQARLDQLTNSSRQVMQKGAVIGVTFEEDVLKEVQDRVANETLEEDIEALTERRLIDELGGDPYSYAFYHGLIHESVYKQLPQRMRQAVHRRVAEALRKVYDNQTDIYRLAHHYYHSNDRINTIDYCLRVAKQDADKWANQTAREWYDRALQKVQSFDETPPSEKEQTDGATPAQIWQWQVEALKGKGEIEAQSGKWQQAVQSYESAERLTRTGSFPPHERADLMRRIGRQYAWGGQLDLALSWMENGRTLLDPERNEVERQALALINIHTASIFYQKGELTQSETLCQHALDLLGEEGDLAIRAEGYNLLGAARDRQGKYQDALMAYQPSIHLWEINSNDYQVKRVQTNLAVTYCKLGEWLQAHKLYSQIIIFFNNSEDHNRLAMALCNIGRLEYEQGEYEKSANSLQRAKKLADDFQIQWIRTLTRVNLASVHLARRKWNQAEILAKETIEIESKHQMNQSQPEAYRLLAEVFIARDQFDQAHHHISKALDLACKQQDRLEEGAAERVLGQVLHFAKNFEAARYHFQRSLKLLNEADNRFEAARTRRELAWFSRDMRDEATAFSHAIEALTEFVKLGAKGEAKSMQAKDRLKFRFQQPLKQAMVFCRTKMTAAGWFENEGQALGITSNLLSADDNRINLYFTCNSYQAVISLTPNTAGTVVHLRMVSA